MVLKSTVDFIITEFIVIAVLCFFLIRHYQGNMVTFDVTCTVYLSWILGFVGVLLLPYDLSVALVDHYQSPVLRDVWIVVYWSTFFLAWVVLPIQMEYHSSGHFSFKEKLNDALMKLLIAAAVAALLAFIYIIYMVASKHSSFSHVLGFMMAMGNTYGIFLITVLMGNGLVGVPKRFWTLANSDSELQRIYISVPPVEEAYQDARYELEDTEAEVEKMTKCMEKAGPGSLFTNEFGPYVTVLQNLVTRFEMHSFSAQHSHETKRHSHVAISETRVPIIPVPEQCTKNQLVSLHAQLISVQHKALASERRWRILVERCKELQYYADLNENKEDLESSVWNTMKMETATSRRKSSVISWIGDSRVWKGLRRWWGQYLFRPFCLCMTVLCGVTSVLILWCEMVMSTKIQSPFGIFMGAYRADDGDSHSTVSGQGVLIQAVSFLMLAYMSGCTYWSLFRINISWAYRLQGPQLSPPSSLIFNAEYFSRLQFALGFNFLMCLNAPNSDKTAFTYLMSNIEIVPVFGTSFQVYMPVIMIFVALITLFDGFSKLFSLVGIESEDVGGSGLTCRHVLVLCGNLDMKNAGLTPEEEAERADKIKIGKGIVASELRRQQHQLKIELSANAKRQRVTNGGDNAPMTNDSLHSNDSGSGGGMFSRYFVGRGGGNNDSKSSSRTITAQELTSTHNPLSQLSEDNSRIDDDNICEDGIANNQGGIMMMPSSVLSSTAKGSQYGRLGSSETKVNPAQSHAAAAGLYSQSNNKKSGVGNASVSKPQVPQGSRRDFASLEEEEEDNFYGGRYADV